MRSASESIPKSDEKPVASVHEGEAGCSGGQEPREPEANGHCLEESNRRQASARSFSIRRHKVHRTKPLPLTETAKIRFGVRGANGNRSDPPSKAEAENPIPHRGADAAIRVVE